jgi:MFS family permease
MAISSNVLVIAVAWCLAYSMLECTETILMACIGDFVPAEHRGTAGAGISVATSAASIAGSYLVGWAHPNPLGMFCLPLVASLLVVPWILFLVPDHCDSSGFRVNCRSAIRLAFARSAQRLQGSLVTLLVSRFLVFGGLAIYVIYQAFDITAHIKEPAAAVPRVVFLAAMAAAVASLICAPLTGYLSDRLGKRKLFALGGGLMLACGLLAIALTASPEGFVLGTCLLGAGMGIYNSQSIALSAAATGGQNVMGKSMGLLTMVGTLPRVVVPLVVPLFLTLEKADNYPILFAAAASMAGLGAFFILNVKSTTKL